MTVKLGHAVPAPCRFAPGTWVATHASGHTYSVERHMYDGFYTVRAGPSSWPVWLHHAQLRLATLEEIAQAQLAQLQAGGL